MSTEPCSCFCNDEWKVADIIAFFALPTTTTKCPGTWHGDPSDVRKVEIKTVKFEGACIVEAISGDAYNFFKKGKKPGLLACQSVFSNWAGGEFQVTFWMKDNGSVE